MTHVISAGALNVQRAITTSGNRWCCEGGVQGKGKVFEKHFCVQFAESTTKSGGKRSVKMRVVLFVFVTPINIRPSNTAPSLGCLFCDDLLVVVSFADAPAIRLGNWSRRFHVPSVARVPISRA